MLLLACSPYTSAAPYPSRSATASWPTSCPRVCSCRRIRLGLSETLPRGSDSGTFCGRAIECANHRDQQQRQNAKSSRDQLALVPRVRRENDKIDGEEQRGYGEESHSYALQSVCIGLRKSQTKSRGRGPGETVRAAPIACPVAPAPSSRRPRKERRERTLARR